jgi:TPR repeat protein
MHRKYYEDGIGVTPDFPRALEYFGKAASKGYQPAAEKLNRPMADGTRRKRTLKKGEKEAEFKFIPIVISVPKVKQDDDDDDDNDGAIDDHQGICKYTQGSKAAAKTGSGSGGSNICKIQ